MLNGIDPIIIFNFKKIPAGLQDTIAKIPLIASIVEAIDLPAIPIYLSERLSGILIDSEEKSIEIQTEANTLSSGGVDTNQRGISSTITINMKANKDSLGVALLSAMADLVFPKVTSKEYSITYLHGAVTVFAGMINSFSVSQNASDDLLLITLSLIKPPPSPPKSPQVDKLPGIDVAQPIITRAP